MNQPRTTRKMNFGTRAFGALLTLTALLAVVWLAALAVSDGSDTLPDTAGDESTVGESPAAHGSPGATRVRTEGDDAEPEDALRSVTIAVAADDSAEFPVLVDVRQAGELVFAGPVPMGGRTSIRLAPGRFTWTASPMTEVGWLTHGSTEGAAADSDGAVLDVLLPRGRSTLHVRVTDSLGEPVPGIVVGLADAPESLHRTTDADGSARWDGLGAKLGDTRMIRVVRKPSGWTVRSAPQVTWTESSEAQGEWKGEASLVLSGSDAFFVAELRDYGGAWEVQAVGADGSWSPGPLQEGGVVGLLEDGAGQRIAGGITLGDDYVLRSRRVPPGRYRLAYLCASGPRLMTAELDLRSGRTGRVSDFQSHDLELLPGRIAGPATGVQAQLSIVHESASAAEGNGPAALSTLQIDVDARGAFVVPLLPGVRSLGVHDPSARDLDPARPAIIPISVASSLRTELLVHSALPGNVAGRVVDPDGKPVAWARVFVAPTPDPRNAQASVRPLHGHHALGPFVADDRGRFETAASFPGTWRVVATRPGTASPENRWWERADVTEIVVVAGTRTEADVNVR